MKIKSVKYVGSYGYPQKLPREQRPEVALFGRSNVGKSSLINSLLGRRGVARISKTPGKTRTANFFLINDRFYFVDMPGYGFAKVPKAERERWTKIYGQYVADKERNNAIIQLIDLRHKPSDDDIESVARFAATGRPLCLAFTKSDKVKRSATRSHIATALGLFDLPRETAVIPFSSVSGEGKPELWAWVADVLSL
jgi:GTP-binding protein